MRRARALDHAWPALALIALGLAALVAVIGVIAAPARPEVERIDDAVETLARAVQERRGEDACAALTPAARRIVAARLGTLDCAATIRSFGLGIDAGRLRAARVVGARVDGDRALVAREQLVLPDGAPFGGAVTLERRGGAWQVARLG